MPPIRSMSAKPSPRSVGWIAATTGARPSRWTVPSSPGGGGGGGSAARAPLAKPTRVTASGRSRRTPDLGRKYSRSKLKSYPRAQKLRSAHVVGCAENDQIEIVLRHPVRGAVQHAPGEKT